MAANVVNASNPTHGEPDPAVHLHLCQRADGCGTESDVRGTTNRAKIRAVEINLLLDMNPGRSPVYTHLRTTAQLRNTR